MPDPTEKTILFADAQTIRKFVAFMERTHAPTEPCKCHADLFAPPARAEAAPDFDAAIERAIASGRTADDARRLEDINETIGLITMASKPEDVNHTLTLTLLGKLREQVSRAR